MQIIQELSPVLLPTICAREAYGNADLVIRLRQAIALPIYAVSLILDFASAALGRLATLVAGDDWPG